MTDYEFFISAMERETEGLRKWLGGAMQADEQSRADCLRSLDLSNCTWGVLSSLLGEAMGNALVKLNWTQFEKFYLGYVGWTRQQPNCPFKEQAEENARGMMWHQLAQHGRTPSVSGDQWREI